MLDVQHPCSRSSSQYRFVHSQIDCIRGEPRNVCYNCKKVLCQVNDAAISIYIEHSSFECDFLSSLAVLVREQGIGKVVRNEPNRQGNDKIDHDQNESFQVVRPVIGDSKVDD